MAKVIGCVPLTRVSTWNKDHEKREARKVKYEKKERTDRMRREQTAKVKAEKKAKTKAEYIPFNMQIRAQLRGVMSKSKSFYYINLPKQVVG